jgi:hypothetical protein
MRPILPTLGIVIALTLAACAHRPAPAAPVGDAPPGWTLAARSPSPKNAHYTRQGNLIVSNADGVASSLRRQVDIDLTKTPCITFSWRADEFPGTGDENAKGGDDFAARVYVVTDVTQKHGVIDYVWARELPVGDVSKSPYSQARRIVLRSGTASSTALVTEVRNVVEDYKNAVGATPSKIIGFALMSDADDTNSRARATFGEIQPISCPAK